MKKIIRKRKGVLRTALWRTQARFTRACVGFSLIELLIVITIIGILVVVFLPTITEGPARARDAQRQSDVADIANAVEMYNQDYNGYPNTSGNWAALDIAGGNADIAALAAYFDKGEIPSDPQDNNQINGGNDGFYVYRDFNDGFIVVADTETDKYTAGYLNGPDLFTGPSFTDATTGDEGEDNVYVYWK